MIANNNLRFEELSQLAPTDTRFRPDQRAYEFGEMRLASNEKLRLEQQQRERRKERHQNHFTWKPLWFDLKLEGKKVVKCEWNNKFW